jgi:TolA-binding protein
MRGNGVGSRVWRYRTVALLSVPLLFQAGCTRLGPAERKTLMQASDLYTRGSYSQAVQRLNSLIRDFPQATEISEAYYVRGLCRTKTGDPRGAAADFEEAIRVSKNEDVVVRSKISLAAVSYQQGQWSKAADLYSDAVPRLPDRPPSDQIVYYAGVALQRAGRWQDARLQFARIIHKMPNSPILADAKRMIGWQHEYFSLQLGAYQDTENAEKAVQAFRTKNLDFVQMENHPWQGRVVWVVMAGRYRSYGEALGALQRVRTAAPDAHVIP